VFYLPETYGFPVFQQGAIRLALRDINVAFVSACRAAGLGSRGAIGLSTKGPGYAGLFHVAEVRTSLREALPPEPSPGASPRTS
jgi:hypothetical protein